MCSLCVFHIIPLPRRSTSKTFLLRTNTGDEIFGFNVSRTLTIIFHTLAQNSSRSFSFGVASFSCNLGGEDSFPVMGRLVVHINEPSELVQRHGVFRLRSYVCWLAMHEGSYHQQCDLFDCILGIRLFTIETKSVSIQPKKIILRLASISAFRLRM